MVGRGARKSDAQRTEQKPAVYEVRCPRCDVSFPPQTRRCMHCGGRTGSSSGGQGIVRLEGSGLAPELADLSFGTDADGRPIRAQPLDESPEEESSGRSGWARSALTLLWIVAAIGFSAMRACQEG